MEMYWDIMARKEDSEKRAATNHSMLEHTNLFADDEAKLSLEDCKRQILKNLQILVMNLISFVLAAHPFDLTPQILFNSETEHYVLIKFLKAYFRPNIHISFTIIISKYIEFDLNIINL